MQVRKGERKATGNRQQENKGGWARAVQNGKFRGRKVHGAQCPVDLRLIGISGLGKMYGFCSS